MSKCILFVAFALAVAVYAQHEVVPEMAEAVKVAPFVESPAVEEIEEPTMELVSAEDNEAAHQEASSYMAKAGAGACKSLADATEKEVTDNIKAQQTIIDKMDKGAQCPKEGQDAVVAMQGKLTSAENTKKAKDKAYNDALNTDVNFGTRKYSSLTKGQCGTFFNSAAYKNAETKVNNAKKAKDKAAGEVTQAKKSLQAAKDAAKVAVKKCQCNTYKTHQKAVADANAKVKSSNTKAWTKAAHLKCVLDGKTTNQCTVPALPKVKGVSLSTGVDSGACSSWDGQKQCGNAVLNDGNGDKTGSDNKLLRVYRKTGDQQWNSGCFMKDEVPKQRTHQYKLYTEWTSNGSGRGGHVHAMWGFWNMQGTAHYYPSLTFAWYCHAVNHHPYVYETGSGYHITNCNCGTWAKTNIYMKTNEDVSYYMSSSQHGEKHCTNQRKNRAVKTTSYVVDESIYGKNCDLKNIELTKLVGNNYVKP